MKHLVGYGRVSTTSGEQADALKGQLSWLEAEGCDPILSDVESGLNVDREGYGALLDLIGRGRVAMLRATRADRLGRDAPELVRLIQLCDRAGVHVSTRDDGVLSARTAEELLLLFVRAALAQGESMKISQRVRGGLEIGRRAGRPMRHPCWGYRLSSDRSRFEPHPTEFAKARRFVDHLILEGWRVFRGLTTWEEQAPFASANGVRAWLRNPTLRGGIGYRQVKNHEYEQVLWDRHEPLMTHAEFAEYVQMAGVNRRNWGANAKRRVRALTGLCVCAECGNRMKYIPDRAHPALRCGTTRCSQLYRSTRETVLISYAINELSRAAASRLAGAVSRAEPPEVIELRRQIESLVALGDPELGSVIEAKAARLGSMLAAPAPQDDLVAKIADARWWHHVEYEELTSMLQTLVRRIVVAKQAPSAIDLKL